MVKQNQTNSLAVAYKLFEWVWPFCWVVIGEKSRNYTPVKNLWTLRLRMSTLKLRIFKIAKEKKNIKNKWSHFSNCHKENIFQIVFVLQHFFKESHLERKKTAPEANRHIGKWKDVTRFPEPSGYNFQNPFTKNPFSIYKVLKTVIH